MKKFLVEIFLLLQNHFLENNLGEKKFLRNFFRLKIVLLQNHILGNLWMIKLFGQNVFHRNCFIVAK